MMTREWLIVLTYSSRRPRMIRTDCYFLFVFYNTSVLNCFQKGQHLPTLVLLSVHCFSLVSPRFDNVARVKFTLSLPVFSPLNHALSPCIISARSTCAHNETIAKILSNRENKRLAFHNHTIEIL